MMTEAAPDAILDAGESGCTDLIMMIFQAMKELKPGQTLEILAHDVAADLDIAAWCHMTGHAMIASHSMTKPKRILVRKRE